MIYPKNIWIPYPPPAWQKNLFKSNSKDKKWIVQKRVGCLYIVVLLPTHCISIDFLLYRLQYCWTAYMLEYYIYTHTTSRVRSNQCLFQAMGPVNHMQNHLLPPSPFPIPWAPSPPSILSYFRFMGSKYTSSSFVWCWKDWKYFLYPFFYYPPPLFTRV